MAGVRWCEVPRSEAFDLLQSTSVGRMCVLERGCPVALPMNFRVLGEADRFRVVVRAALGSTVASHAGPAALEVDQIDLDRGSAWSVLVRGALRPVESSDSLPDPSPLLEDRHEWMILDVTAVSARRFTLASQDSFSVDWGVGAG